MSLRWCSLFVVAAGACGGGSEMPFDADVPDAVVPDAVALDANAPDASVPDSATSYWGQYVVDSIAVPTDPATTDGLGFDLDGDGDVDNQLGQVAAALVAAAGGNMNAQPAVSSAVDRGGILWLLRGYGCGPATCLATYAGANAMPAPCASPDDATCRHHLDGAGQFDVDDRVAIDAAVSGTLADNVFDGGPGRAVIPYAFPGGEPFWLELVGARIHATAVGASVGESHVGGEIPQATIDSVMVPNFHLAFASALAGDCSLVSGDCRCADDSMGETARALFTNETADCVLTLDETRGSPIVAALFRPDIDTDDDGIRDALSVGVGFTAVAATFEP